jgi:Raf kinase inhibitor-like YbhB/YbcL family protein
MAPDGNASSQLAGLDVGDVPEWSDPLVVTSEAFEDGGALPARCTAEGAEVSPPLSWAGVPRRAVELALVCHDPDAPAGPVVHWLVSGIAPSAQGVAEGSEPMSSVVGRNSGGERRWMGPQPPPGDGPHRYVFTVVAAAGSLGLGADSDVGDLLLALPGREVARGRLVGSYERGEEP